MDMLISRILKYINGCFAVDDLYRIGTYIIKNYHQIFRYNLDQLTEASHFTKEEITDFCTRLGYDSFDEFKAKLWSDHQMRLDQIHARMLNIDLKPFLEGLNTSYSNEEFKDLLEKITDLIFNKKRIIIIGSLYPSSVAVDFQTDMISLGKEVIEFPSFDPEFMFNEDDMVIFLTATGRSLKACVKKTAHQHICEADIVLVTQNIIYREYENVCADEVIHVLGKFDGLQFNYQIMMILDLMRIRYYQKFYQ